NILGNIDQAIKQATCTIAVLSPAYFDSLSASTEWTAAFYKALQNEQGLFLPVQVRAGAIEGILGPLAPIDLVGLDVNQAQALLLEYVEDKRRKPLSPPSFPGLQRPSFPGPSSSTLPVWGVPHPYNSFFVGRKDTLALLEQRFRTNVSQI